MLAVSTSSRNAENSENTVHYLYSTVAGLIVPFWMTSRAGSGVWGNKHALSGGMEVVPTSEGSLSSGRY